MPLLAPVTMRDPLEGDRPIDLVPSRSLWLAFEAAHGGSLGAIYIDTKIGRVSLKVQTDLVYRCARAGGSELRWPEVADRVHALGLFESTELVLRLFADVFPERSEAAAPGEEEAGAVPLAGGG